MTETVLQTHRVLPSWMWYIYFWSVLLLGIVPCVLLFPLNVLFVIGELTFNSLSSEYSSFKIISIAGFLGVFAAFKAILCIVGGKPVSHPIVVFGFFGVISSVYLIVFTYDEVRPLLGVLVSPIVAYFITLHYNYTLKKYIKINPSERVKGLSDSTISE